MNVKSKFELYGKHSYDGVKRKNFTDLKCSEEEHLKAVIKMQTKRKKTI